MPSLREAVKYYLAAFTKQKTIKGLGFILPSPLRDLIRDKVLQNWHGMVFDIRGSTLRTRVSPLWTKFLVKIDLQVWRDSASPLFMDKFSTIVIDGLFYRWVFCACLSSFFDRLIVKLLCYGHYYSYCHLISNKNVLTNRFIALQTGCFLYLFVGMLMIVRL